MSSYTVVSRKGQITIPLAIREALGIEEGDKIELILNEGDRTQATLQRVPSITESTYGIARWQGEAIDLSAYDRAVEDEIVAEARRELNLPDHER